MSFQYADEVRFNLEDVGEVKGIVVGLMCGHYMVESYHDGQIYTVPRDEARHSDMKFSGRNPAQGCPKCGMVVTVKPVNNSKSAWHAALDSMCERFERHLGRCEGKGE